MHQRHARRSASWSTLRAEVPIRTLLAILLASACSSLAFASDITAITADGRKVLLHEDGTWDLAAGEKAGPSAPRAEPSPPAYDIEVSVTGCTTGPSYAGLQMSAVSRTDTPLSRVEVRYTWRDRKGEVVVGQSWLFDEIHPGVQAVEQVQAVFDVSCADLASVQLTGATCFLPRTRERIDCFTQTRMVDGAIPVAR